jgi:hypothetical protein
MSARIKCAMDSESDLNDSGGSNVQTGALAQCGINVPSNQPTKKQQSHWQPCLTVG